MCGKESSNPVSYQLPHADVHLRISGVQSLNPRNEKGQMRQNLLPAPSMNNNLLAHISLQFLL